MTVAVWTTVQAEPQEPATVDMGQAVSQPSSTPIRGPSGSSKQVGRRPSEKVGKTKIFGLPDAVCAAGRANETGARDSPDTDYDVAGQGDEDNEEKKNIEPADPWRGGQQAITASPAPTWLGKGGQHGHCSWSEPVRCSGGRCWSLSLASVRG